MSEESTQPKGNLGQLAVSYVRNYRWKLSPLVPQSKEPLIKNWPDAATSEVGQISKWWRRWPQANIGLLCGQASGVVVVDIDPRSGGTEAWAELIDIRGRVDTLEAMSGGGGSHYFFQAPDYILAKGKLGAGVDLQGERSYLVLTPSLHPCGDPYEWVTEGVAPAPLPEWLLNLWPRAGRRINRRQAVPPLLDTIPEGQRNSSLASLAGSMRRRGASEAAIAAALLEENARCLPPLPEAEVLRIAISIAQYAPAQGSAAGYPAQRHYRPLPEIKVVVRP